MLVLLMKQFVYNVLDESLNKINIETRLTIIEVSQSLTQDIKIELPLIAKNGNEFTIIMGQSISQYIGDYHVILTGKFLSIDGIGPGDGEIKFKTTGQAVKLMSVLSEKSHIFGYENNYYQILYNHVSSVSISTEIISAAYTFEDKIFDINSINIVDNSVYQSIVNLPTQLNNDVYIVIPFVNSPGIEKVINFQLSVDKNINNHKILYMVSLLIPQD